jgi:hypothetical protein
MTEGPNAPCFTDKLRALHYSTALTPFSWRANILSGDDTKQHL